MRICLVEPGPIKTEFMDAINSLVPAGGSVDPILDNAAPWMTARVSEVARRIVGLLDHPRRRLSVLRRFVWIFRFLGVGASLCPPLGDRIVGRASPAVRCPGRDHGFSEPTRGASFMSLVRNARLLRARQVQPHAVRLALRSAGSGAGGLRPRQSIPTPPGLGRDLALHGRGPFGGDGVQPAGRSVLSMRSNPRTAGRHLPAGQLSVGAVATFTASPRRPSSPRRCSSCRTDGRSLSLRPGVALALGLLLHQAVHEPRPFLAGCSR